MTTTTTTTPTTRSRGGTALVLVFGAALLTAVFGLLGWALGDHSSPAETRLIRHLEQGRSSVVTSASKVLSTIGSQSVLVPIAAVVAVILVVRGRAALAVVVALSAIGGIALSNIVKVLIDRARPANPHLVTVASSSFPSGHATQAMAILPALGLAAIAFGVHRVVAMSLAVVGAVAIGVSRVLLGVHYPTDVVAGWLLGGAWVALTAAAISPGGSGRDRRSTPHDAPSS